MAGVDPNIDKQVWAEMSTIQSKQDLEKMMEKYQFTENEKQQLRMEFDKVESSNSSNGTRGLGSMLMYTAGGAAVVGGAYLLYDKLMGKKQGAPLPGQQPQPAAPPPGSMPYNMMGTMDSRRGTLTVKVLDGDGFPKKKLYVQLQVGKQAIKSPESNECLWNFEARFNVTDCYMDQLLVSVMDKSFITADDRIGTVTMLDLSKMLRGVKTDVVADTGKGVVRMVLLAHDFGISQQPQYAPQPQPQANPYAKPQAWAGPGYAPQPQQQPQMGTNYGNPQQWHPPVQPQPQWSPQQAPQPMAPSQPTWNPQQAPNNYPQQGAWQQPQQPPPQNPGYFPPQQPQQAPPQNPGYFPPQQPQQPPPQNPGYFPPQQQQQQQQQQPGFYPTQGPAPNQWGPPSNQQPNWNPQYQNPQGPTPNQYQWGPQGQPPNQYPQNQGPQNPASWGGGGYPPQNWQQGYSPQPWYGQGQMQGQGNPGYGYGYTGRDIEGLESTISAKEVEVKATFQDIIAGGLLTEEKLRSEFAKFDIDNNGWLAKEEFKEIYKCYNVFDETEKGLDELLSKYNMLGDDKISYEEFAIILLKLQQR